MYAVALGDPAHGWILRGRQHLHEVGRSHRWQVRSSTDPPTSCILKIRAHPACVRRLRLSLPSLRSDGNSSGACFKGVCRVLHWRAMSHTKLRSELRTASNNTYRPCLHISLLRYSIDDGPHTTDILLEEDAAGKTSIGPIIVADGISDAGVRTNVHCLALKSLNSYSSGLEQYTFYGGRTW